MATLANLDKPHMGTASIRAGTPGLASPKSVTRSSAGAPFKLNVDPSPFIDPSTEGLIGDEPPPILSEKVKKQMKHAGFSARAMKPQEMDDVVVGVWASLGIMQRFRVPSDRPPAHTHTAPGMVTLVLRFEPVADWGVDAAGMVRRDAGAARPEAALHHLRLERTVDPDALCPPRNVSRACITWLHVISFRPVLLSHTTTTHERSPNPDLDPRNSPKCGPTDAGSSRSTVRSTSSPSW